MVVRNEALVLFNKNLANDNIDIKIFVLKRITIKKKGSLSKVDVLSTVTCVRISISSPKQLDSDHQANSVTKFILNNLPW